MVLGNPDPQVLRAFRIPAARDDGFTLAERLAKVSPEPAAGTGAPGRPQASGASGCERRERTPIREPTS
jgi:hypothetical protein